MDVLIVGSGGREHAIGWKARQNPAVERLYFAPGNGGTADIGTNLPLKVTDIEELAVFAAEHAIALTIVGPALPLQLGIVDAFHARGLKIFGPGRQAAQLETSKAFAKAFMRKYDIPTAAYETYDDLAACLEALERRSYPLVVKADGLAEGRGVVVCQDRIQAAHVVTGMMSGKAFGTAGERVVLEEFLEGEEASLVCFTDGETIVPMESAGDYKRVFDYDRGPNTGGMGSISPAAGYPPGMGDEIAAKTLAGIRGEGFDYRGVIYLGLVLTKQGPKVLEYNVRFGEPETEVVMLRLDTDVIEIALAVAERRLSEIPIRWKSESAVCVCLASGGYPGKYRAGFEITGVSEPAEGVAFFHGGTALESGKLVTAGGRVMMVSALGADMKQARERAYENVWKINFHGCNYRKDIGRAVQ